MKSTCAWWRIEGQNRAQFLVVSAQFMRRILVAHPRRHNLNLVGRVQHLLPVTVMRDWSSAQAWLYRELTGGTGDGFRTVETSR